MSAIPILPGRLYSVRCTAGKIIVIAAHPCDAICIALELLGGAA
ncbi:hypothetical protein [Burkholderia cenocepacia]|nr:hypothetical protein [Burkholderia cenocepacia]